MRADRIANPRSDCFIMAETDMTNILAQAVELDPDVLIIDSIQTVTSKLVESPPGSVSQVRERASELQRFAKEVGIPVFIIGHINKDYTIMRS